MKKNTFKTVTKNIFLSLTVLLAMVSFTSCAKKVAFQTSTIVPAARGDVKIKKDENKNYIIKIELENLAEISRIEPSRNVYVVWLETDESSVKNIGQIDSDSNFLSSKLKASFETVTSFTPKKIFITAEENADVQYPGMPLIMETNKF